MEPIQHKTLRPLWWRRYLLRSMHFCHVALRSPRLFCWLESVPFPSDGNKDLRCELQSFCHQTDRSYFSTLMAFDIRRDIAAASTIGVEKRGGQGRQKRLAPRSECRSPMLQPQSRFGGKRSTSFPNSETPKLLILSRYLIRARIPSDWWGSTARTCLHFLNHASCKSSRLGLTILPLAQYRQHR